jgi:alpha/beta superfamily hydrolase
MTTPPIAAVEADQFTAANHPDVVTEWDAIETIFKQSKSLLNIDLLISFIKDHSMEILKIKAYPEWAKKIKSQSIAFAKTEALFSEKTNEKKFREQLEEYIRMRCSV